MGEIGDKAGFVCPAGHGNGYPDCFTTELNFDEKNISFTCHSSV